MTLDLMSKFRRLSPDIAAAITPAIHAELLPPEARALLSAGGQHNVLTPLQRKPVDIAVVTVIQEELEATKIIFGLGLNVRETRASNTLRYYETEVSNEIGEGLKVVITMVGEPHNTPCASACAELFQHYDPKLCVLVGIAAGLEGLVELGDVVGATQIIDYESARLEPGVRRQQPTPYSLEPRIRRDFLHFNPLRGAWRTVFFENVGKLRDLGAVPAFAAGWAPKYHRGVVVAGEKLLADGTSLPGMRDEYHEKVRAGEQEGSGFARTCDDRSIPWLVFRGISDYGSMAKPEHKVWQRPAALAAAAALMDFARREYRSPEQHRF
jgi:nucleoside phosphorylase